MKRVRKFYARLDRCINLMRIHLTKFLYPFFFERRVQTNKETVLSRVWKSTLRTWLGSTLTYKTLRHSSFVIRHSSLKVACTRFYGVFGSECALKNLYSSEISQPKDICFFLQRIQHKLRFFPSKFDHIAANG